MEQFIRAFTFEPYDFYKVLTLQEFNNVKVVLDEVLNGYKPQPFKFNLKGASNTAKFLLEMHNGL